MPEVLPLAFALLAMTALAAVVAGRLQVPAAIVLFLFGIAVAFVPGLPRVSLEPDLVLLVLLPPLLYSSGVGMSWRGFKANLRPILLLAVGCVLFTAAAVAAVVHHAFGLPWAVGFVLGAVVSPPDAVAPMAIAERLLVPKRVLTILEGEGLVNDATALILFGFAVSAVATGELSLANAVAEFVAIAVGEAAWGAAIGWAMLRLRARAHDPQVEIVLALLTPFAAFWPPHLLGGSGVLATVAAGLYVSWNGPRFIAPATRLQGFFVWDLMVFVVTGIVFLLTGLEARALTSGLDLAHWERLLAVGAVVCAVVVVVRFVWVFPATYLPRLSEQLRGTDPAPHWRYPLVIAFTGIRGVVSLAAALSVPAMAGARPFPDRELVLFSTYLVIFVTLVGQGLSLPWVIRASGLAAAGRREAAESRRREIEARVAGVDAALEKLDALEREGAPPALVDALRQRHVARRRHLLDSADARTPGSPAADESRLQLRLVASERARVARSYADGDIDDAVRRRVERELDLEEARARHALDGATPLPAAQSAAIVGACGRPAEEP